MEDELFQLSNGRYVTSVEISEKLTYIKEHHPETSYQEDSTGYSWDEAGMADLFSECYDHDTRYCPEAKSWYTYDGGKWQKDVGSLLVSNKIKEFVRIMALYCGEIPDEDKRKQYMAFVGKMGDRRFRDRLKPQFTMWLSCNDLPAVKDKSLFASDRVRVIEFNRHFNDDEQDKGLKDYFESPEAMRGIFTWLVAGYFKYRRFGLKMSANMQKVVKQYEKDNDLVLQYLEEKCQKQDDVKTRAKTLYDNYKLWCKSNGYYVCSMKKFNAELMAHPEWYEQKSVSGGVAVYYGIMMKTTG